MLRPSEAAALHALERIINQSKTEGFYAALAMVEREIYSVSDLDELYAWISAAVDTARTAEASFAMGRGSVPPAPRAARPAARPDHPGRSS